MENQINALQKSLANADTKSKRNREELLDLSKSSNYSNLRLMISPAKNVSLEGVIEDTLHIFKKIKSGERSDLTFSTKD
jgi:predicted  nucleic acid-binding Zn-ribbon protein